MSRACKGWWLSRVVAATLAAGCAHDTAPGVAGDGGPRSQGDGDGDGTGPGEQSDGSAGDAAPGDDSAAEDGGRPSDGGQPEPPRSFAQRARSIPIGIENVNDSPMKDASYRALLRFVPTRDLEIDRLYFGFKLKGAACWQADAGYGAGDGGTLEATLVRIDARTGLPSELLDRETINGCTRHDEAAAELGGDPVLVWASLRGALERGAMYGLVVRNVHPEPASNFFSFNMPLADTQLAGPHARNELSASAGGAILGLDPREHVAWSSDDGASWQYGSDNGQYRSYMNDHDTAHPATRMPQYGFRLANGDMLAGQPYYAYSDDCQGCSASYGPARYARTLSELGGFVASDVGVGTLSVRNDDTGQSASCTPAQGYGFGRCTLTEAVQVAAGESYTVSSSGSVEIMRMDRPQRVLFPGVGSAEGEIRIWQREPAANTNDKDVPSVWAGPLSTHYPTEEDL